MTNLNGSFTFTDNCGDIAACNGPGGPNAAEAASLSKTKLGYTVGGGVEAGLWGNWSLKAEYLYVKFNSESVVGFISTPGLQPFAANNPFTHSIDLKAHIARARPQLSLRRPGRRQLLTGERPFAAQRSCAAGEGTRIGAMHGQRSPSPRPSLGQNGERGKSAHNPIPPARLDLGRTPCRY